MLETSIFCRMSIQLPMDQNLIRAHIDLHYKESNKQVLEYWLKIFEEEVPDAKNKKMEDFVNWTMKSYEYSFTADFNFALSTDDKKMIDHIHFI